MPVRLKDIYVDVHPVTWDMPARSAFSIFASNPDLDAIVVVADNDVKGLVTRGRLSEILAGANGETVLGSRKIAHVMETRFASAELEVPVAAAAKKAAEQNSPALTDGIVLLEQGRLLGYVPPKAILKAVAEENAARARAMHKSKKRIAAAQNEIAAEAKHRSQMFAKLSHEIRTPLTGILGVADLLVDSSIPKQPRRYAKTIASSGRLLDRLLGDMLDLSRMEAGKLSLNPEPLNLRDFANETRDLWMANAEDRDVSLRISLSKGSHKRVFADGTRLKQILFNLLSNALKFTQSGYIEVTLATREREDGELFLEMQVADTGCGIPDEHKQRMFKDFEQISSRSAAVYGGSGMGLSIAKNLTELMGGTIKLSDNPDGGSVFDVEVAIKKIGPKLAVANPKRPRRGRLELGEILIIEDHRVSQMVMEKALTAAGWKVDCVYTCEQGLRRASGKQYQAILIDRYLPDGKGDDLLARLRSEAVINQSIPMLLVTADVTAERRAAAEELGFDGFIAKPIRPRDLVAGLADILMQQDALQIARRVSAV